MLVAEVDGRLVGYCALTPFHPNTGYRLTTTASIYVHADHRRSGVGHAMCAKMWDEAKARGYHTVIGGVNAKNTASLELLKSFGFKEAGYFKQIGNKNGEWFDEICLQLMLD